MSGESPAAILYNSSGVELSVSTATAIPTGTSGLLVSGSDGTNSRFLSVDASGRAVLVGAGVAGTPAGGVLSIQGVASGTAMPVSGTITANAGTGNFNVIGTGTAGTAATGVVTIQGIASMTPIAISGTVTANNASVSATGAAVPSSATFIGGSVTTAAPSYTTGNISALSLTTTGLLRVDSSGTTQPVSGTITANIGTTNGLALDATLTGGTATSRITDGTNTATVKAASTAAVATDKALVVALSPNNPITVTVSKSSTSAVTSVVSAAVTTSILASNTNRLIGSIFNASNKIMYVKYGATASLTSYSIALYPNSYLEIPSDYTGAIDAIWQASPTGNALVTEFTV
jgi:hypothetical protein